MTQNKQNKKERVVVAMSGGVDSSVAACILKEQGYDVVGISLKVWDEEQVEGRRGKTCCSYNDIQDARFVCDRLGIPFYAFNYKEEFQEKVIQNFVDEYQKGRTPNPCILCNRHIKFDQLLNEAKKLGASYLATGHHVRVFKDDQDVYHLLKGVDSEKDQSYVLYHLNQNHLSRLLFPIGDYTKAQIRDIAEKYNLVTAQKPESQDICFIPNRDHAQFIEKYLGDHQPRPHGHFIDQSGNNLGPHEGIYKYTVGQRRGLGVSAGERIYVTDIDVKSGNVILGSQEDLNKAGLMAKDIHWVKEFPKEDLEKQGIGVKIRYQKTEIPSKILLKDDGRVEVYFQDKNLSVSPGQSAVFYHDDEVLGGGIIEKSINYEFSV